MRLLVITSLLGSATSFADESTEARVRTGDEDRPQPRRRHAAGDSPKAGHTNSLLVFPWVLVRRLRVDSGVVSAPGVRTERSAFRQRFLSGALCVRAPQRRPVAVRVRL